MAGISIIPGGPTAAFTQNLDAATLARMRQLQLQQQQAEQRASIINALTQGGGMSPSPDAGYGAGAPPPVQPAPSAPGSPVPPVGGAPDPTYQAPSPGPSATPSPVSPPPLNPGGPSGPSAASLAGGPQPQQQRPMGFPGQPAQSPLIGLLRRLKADPKNAGVPDMTLIKMAQQIYPPNQQTSEERMLTQILLANQSDATKQRGQDLTHEDKGAARDELSAYRMMMLQLMQNKNDQQNDQMVPGKGQDADGNPVDGAYILNKKTGTLDFKPGVVIGGAQKPPANAFAAAYEAEQKRRAAAGEPPMTATEITDLKNSQNTPRSAAGMSAQLFMENWKKTHGGEKPSPQDLQEFVATQAGLSSRERTAGSYGARVDMAAQEVEQLMPQARQASANLPRTWAVPVNKMVQSFEAGTSDPRYYDFAFANWSLLNAFTRAINPTGVPRLEDKEHGSQLLSTATDQKSYDAVLARMQKEVTASQRASRNVLDDPTGQNTGPGRGAGTVPAGAPTATDDQGNKVYWDGTGWKPAPKAQ